MNVICFVIITALYGLLFFWSVVDHRRWAGIVPLNIPKTEGIVSFREKDRAAKAYLSMTLFPNHVPSF